MYLAVLVLFAYFASNIQVEEEQVICQKNMM